MFAIDRLRRAAGFVLRSAMPVCRSGRRPLRTLLVLLMPCLAPVIPTPAAAHELRPAIATVMFADGSARLELTLNLEAAIAGIGVGHESTEDSQAAPLYERLRSLEPEALRAELASQIPRIVDGVSVTVNGQRVPLTIDRVEIPPVGDTGIARVSTLMLRGPAPALPETMEWQLDPQLGDSVVRLRDSASGDLLRADHVPAGAVIGPLPLHGAESKTWTTTFVEYVEAGFVHIVPRGLDHILFVIGLFLLSTRLSALMWQVSAFTLAHSVTLALGAIGAVSLPPHIVEPVIALSIAYVAIENLMTDRLHRWRPVVVFAFGLLHGLGFAGVLGEVGLSSDHFATGLVAFNIGVELGQLAVIAACFVVVGGFMRTSWYRVAVVTPISLAIISVAGYWAAERSGLV